MEKRRVGSLEVTVVGLGCNNFGMRVDYERTEEVVNAAIDAGINFFDTADLYGAGRSEEYLGRALHGRRSDVLIATKFGMKLDEHRSGARPEYIRRAVEDSLTRLNTDYIDLYQLHVPDPNVAIEDTLGALDDLVKAGKVREIGCSNFQKVLLTDADTAAGHGARFVSVQNEYNLLHRDPEREVLPECVRLGLAFLPFFPLASGMLTGKYRKGEDAPAGTRLGSGAAWTARFTSDKNFAAVEALEAFASSRNHTILELAMSWLAVQPSIASIIAGATSPEQVHANASAVNWQVTDADLAEIDTILQPATDA